MTELHIDSKTPKFDRRNVLKGAAAIPVAAVPVTASAGDDQSLRLWAEYEAQEKREIAAYDRLERAEKSLPPDYLWDGPGREFRKREDIDKYFRFNGHVKQERKDAVYNAFYEVVAKRKAAEQASGIDALSDIYDREHKKSMDILKAYFVCEPTTPEGITQKMRVLIEFDDITGDNRLEKMLDGLPTLIRRVA